MWLEQIMCLKTNTEQFKVFSTDTKHDNIIKIVLELIDSQKYIKYRNNKP